MCFEHLPIEFDADGRASLRDGGDFAVTAAGPPREPPARAATRPVRLDIDPVTRVAGALAFHAEIDAADRTVVDAHAEAVLFRGYELILQGRRPEQAIEISSRACGVCGGVHSTCAAMAIEMAAGTAPPPLAIIARNLGEAAELLYDHCLHLFLLAGPDYSEQMVRRTTPSIWARAETALAPGAPTHGFMTVGELMEALNPLRGRLALEALEVTRSAREIVALAFGKYPHPSAMVPAGLGTKLDHTTLNQILARIVRLLDWAKRVAAVWEDVIGFMLEAQPRFAEVGVRRANLICTGIWDEPGVYDARYATMDAWGAARLSPPGVVLDGALRTDRLSQICLGIEEFVEHSFYEAWDGEPRVPTAPDGSPLSPHHPWNKSTTPRPEGANWKERYSWSTAPRWDREPMESGPLARHWVAALRGMPSNQFMEAGGGTMRIAIPRGDLAETALEWRVPAVPNAAERIRARAVHVGFCLMAAYSYLLQAFDYLREGETQMSRPYEVPDEGLGMGIWEAGRGTLTHNLVLEQGRIASYQILTPSTWMASPRDPWDVPGPYEEAAMATPILEEHDPGSDGFVGIDLLRAIRSFDPCLPCAVHMHTGGGRVVSRDATSCACGMEA